jgi:hypothetical protein
MAHMDPPAADRPLPIPMASKDSLRRAAVVMVAPVLAYALVRPAVSSDALALAIAAAIPIVYGIALAFVRRRIDLLAVLSVLGFSLACLISVLTGDSSLPLKLHEAFITFGIGLVLVVGVLVGRPLPIGRLLRLHPPDKQLDRVLGAMVGGFLLLHALLHLALAASMSTSSYLVAGRVVDGGTLALGVVGLTSFLRRSGVISR